MADNILQEDRVCSRHFVSAEAAKYWDRFNVDWVPTLHPGKSKQHVKYPEEAPARARRAAKTRKSRAEIAEKEVEEKVKRLGVTGETADEIFYEAEPEAERLWMLMTKIQKTRRNYTTVMTVVSLITSLSRHLVCQ